MRQLQIFLAIILLILVGCSPKKLILPSDFEINNSFKVYKRVAVNSRAKDWTNTGIEVMKGDKVLIFASGTIKHFADDIDNEASKKLYIKINKNYISKAVWSLNQSYFEAKSDGTVMFGIADNGFYLPGKLHFYNDNSGEYIVDIFILTEDQEIDLAENLFAITKMNPENLDLKKRVDSFVNSYYMKNVEKKKNWLKYREQDILTGYIGYLASDIDSKYITLALERIDEIIYSTYQKNFWNLEPRK